MKTKSIILIIISILMMLGITGCFGNEETKLSQIEVLSLKDQYFQNDDFEKESIKLNLIYSDGSEKMINNDSKIEIEGFDNTKQGEQEIIVKYEDKSTTTIITINELILKKIYFRQEPYKTEYLIGEKLSLKGLLLKGKYSNGEDIDLKEITEEDITGFDTSTIGIKEMTITYQGQQATFQYTVKDSEVLKLYLNSVPLKTTYYVGLDTELDLRGLEVEATYSDYVRRPLTITNNDILNLDLTTEGDQELTIYYQGQTKTFEIEVIGISSLEIVSEPTKINYMLNESLSLAGLKVKAKYKDGAVEYLNNNDLNISGYDSSFSGERTITLIYFKEDTNFKVEISEEEYVAIKNIEILSQPKLEYKVGEKLNLNDLVLDVTYNDNTTKLVKENELELIKDINNSLSGKQNIVLRYEGTNINLEIEVIGLKMIEVESLPDQIAYGIKDELDLTGFRIKKTYKDNTSEINQLTDEEKEILTTEFENINGTIGSKKIYYTIYGKTLEIPLFIVLMGDNVKRLASMNIIKYPLKTVYKIGKTVDLTGIKIEGTYITGLVEEINTSDLVVLNSELIEEGEQELLILFDGITTSIDIEVIGIKKIDIYTELNKTEYKVGEKLDLRGLSIEIEYTTGEKEVKEVTEEQVSGFYSDIEGNRTLIVSIFNKSVTIPITVKESDQIIISDNDVKSINIEAKPIKTNYYINRIEDQELDLTGLALRVNYEDGKENLITIKNSETQESQERLTCLGFDNSEAISSQKITLVYGEETTSYTVKIVGIKTIDFKNLPNKMLYGLNEELDLTGTKLEVTYTDYTSEVRELTEEEINSLKKKFDSSTTGIKNLYLEYYGKGILLSPSVKEDTDPQVTSITVETKPIKTTYYINREEDQNLDLIGLKLRVKYDDDTNKLLEINKIGDKIDGLNVIGFSLTGAESNQNITFSYSGQITSYTVKIVEIKSIDFEQLPNKLIYASNEELELIGALLKVTYTNYTSEIRELTEDEVNSLKGKFDSGFVGTKNLYLDYYGELAYLSLTVASNTEASVTSIKVESKPIKTTYYINREEDQNLDLIGLKLRVKYDDDTNKLLEINEIGDKIEGLNVIGFNLLEVSSSQRITLTYKDETTSYTVKTVGIKSVEFESLPNKMVYGIYEELELEGSLLKITYTDYTSEIRELTEDEVNSLKGKFDSDTLGTKNLYLEYYGKMALLSLTVKSDSDPEVTDIKLISDPSKEAYYIDRDEDDVLDITGIILKVTYDNDEEILLEKGDIEASEEIKFLGFSLNEEGSIKISVIYQNQTESFDVNIVKINKVTIVEGLDKTVFSLDYDKDNFKEKLNSVKIKVQYTDYSDITRDLTSNEKEILTEEFELLQKNEETGDQIIGVDIFNYYFNMNIHFKGIESIELINSPTKTNYFVGQELDLSGMSVKIDYTDDTEKIVESASNFSFNPANFEFYDTNGFIKSGEFTIKIKENYVSAMYVDINVIVTSAERDRLEVISRPTKYNYLVGETIDLSGLKAEMFYEDGSSIVYKWYKDENVNNEITSGNIRIENESGKLIEADLLSIKNNVGTYKLYIEKYEKTDTFTIIVDDKSIVNYKVATNSDNKGTEENPFYEGDILNLSGLKLIATYDTGATKELSLAELTYFDENGEILEKDDDEILETEGIKKIHLQVGNTLKTDTALLYSLYVEKNTIAEIDWFLGSSKTYYKDLKEELDVSHIDFYVNMKNGKSFTLNDFISNESTTTLDNLRNCFTLNVIDVSEAGNIDIKFDIDEFKRMLAKEFENNFNITTDSTVFNEDLAIFTIEVKEPYIEKITNVNFESKKYYLGEKISISNIDLLYNNSTEKTVTTNDTEITFRLKNNEIKNVGEINKLYFVLNENTDDELFLAYTISDNEDPISAYYIDVKTITVLNDPNQRLIGSGANIDLTGLTLKFTYEIAEKIPEGAVPSKTFQEGYKNELNSNGDLIEIPIAVTADGVNIKTIKTSDDNEIKDVYIKYDGVISDSSYTLTIEDSQIKELQVSYKNNVYYEGTEFDVAEMLSVKAIKTDNTTISEYENNLDVSNILYLETKNKDAGNENDKLVLSYGGQEVELIGITIKHIKSIDFTGDYKRNHRYYSPIEKGNIIWLNEDLEPKTSILFNNNNDNRIKLEATYDDNSKKELLYNKLEEQARMEIIKPDSTKISKKLLQFNIAGLEVYENFKVCTPYIIMNEPYLIEIDAKTETGRADSVDAVITDPIIKEIFNKINEKYLEDGENILTSFIKKEEFLDVTGFSINGLELLQGTLNCKEDDIEITDYDRTTEGKDGWYDWSEEYDRPLKATFTIKYSYSKIYNETNLANWTHKEDTFLIIKVNWERQ